MWGFYSRLLQDIVDPKWCKQLLADLAEWKLCGKINSAEAPSPKPDDDLLLKAAHIVCPHWAKQVEVPATTAVLEAVLVAKSTIASGKESAAGDKENKPEDDAEQSAGSAPAPKPSLERAQSKMEDTSRVINVAQVATFPIGSQVRTTATKSKKEYHGHRGEIQVLMNKKARVLLMEGPKNGSTL